MLSVFFGKTQVSGQRLDLGKTWIQPSMNIRGEKAKYYTVIIAHSDNRAADFLIWLVVNINNKTYEEVLSYYVPKPLSGLQQYNIYLLEQENKLDIGPFDRNKVDIRDFIEMNLLHIKDTQYFSIEG
jgi:hypothetical protein